MAGPIRIGVVADVKELGPSLSSAERSMEAAAKTAERAAGRIDSSFESTAGHADNVASKGAQAAGALGGLGGLAELAGGKVGALGSAMAVAGVATQGLADAGDLLNVVTESTIAKSVIAKAAWLGDIAVKGASTVATGVLTAATTGLGIAMAVATSPITLIALGLAGVVAAVILTIKHFDTIKATAEKTFGAIGNAAEVPFDWIKDHWPLVLTILTGPIGLAASQIIKHWDDIWDGIKSLPGRIRGLGGDMLGAGTHLADKLVDGITSIGGQGEDIAKGIVNKVIDLLNDVLPHSINIDKGPVHLHVPLFPNIDPLATGGITTGPTLALIGDNPGGREAVIPLDKYELGGGNTYHINVTVPVGASPEEVGRTLVGYIDAYEGKGGRRRAS